jgi:hypothetical protein
VGKEGDEAAEEAREYPALNSGDGGINLIEIPLGDLITGLRLTIVGIAVVFFSLFGIEILIRVIGRIWGPKEEVSQARPPEMTEKGG